jgi:hypothetical protein
MRQASTWTLLLLVLAAAVPAVCLSGQTTAFPTFVVPDVPDVTIKTRRTIDHPNSTVETEILFLKRAWQRRERILQFPPTVNTRVAPPYITITRCDERRSLRLNPEARTFASSAIEDMTEHVRRLRAASGRSPIFAPGANVKIAIDSVDTGERRQVGHFLARHVITTTTTEAEPGANAHAGKSIQDGWYIDLPPANCWDWGDHQPILWGSVVRAGSPPDRVQLEHRRTAQGGFPIEETSRTHDDRHPTTRVTLIEFSEVPLDNSLFTVPSGYRAALPRLHGGFDMTKPDTLTNRLESYWEEVTSWAQLVLRF